jgi:hypothetical protein
MAAYGTGSARIDSLTPLFDLMTHRRDEKGRKAIASSLDALIETVTHIEGRYSKIEAEAKAKAKAKTVPEKPVPFDRFFQNTRKYPYMTSYEDDGGEVMFTYDERLDDTKLVFSASADESPAADPDEFLVKFVRRHSKDAYRHLANLGFAPRLQLFATIPGGWSAVVMDKSDYEPLYGMELSA